ncbi:uncharacterized protein LOC110609476 [Manihot esculenta]|uniref:LysM domain-containing protein n=1 Tax=Manihot esculenta TaxID=3983 RepID=A0A2C9WG81_MANES|nr:uncharacterized protein LOC110609476 [Manihot esculenta]OAY58964.1 hypothetical protein MANES_02G220300v8 [Manihot esculenta]
MSSSNGSSSAGGEIADNHYKNFIQHQVSKFDTLAGVAIKYGVEVADIKRLNGLATDLQMFALKTLLIPLPGRHPPSPIFSSDSSSSEGNDIDKTSQPCYSNGLESFDSLRLKSTQEKASPAMSTLWKYYGLKSSKQTGTAEGIGMTKVYRRGSSDSLTEGLLPRATPIYESPYHNLKSRNFANGLSPEDGTTVDYVPLADAGDAEGDKSNEKSVRRRQKSEADFRNGTPERLLKEEKSGGSSDFSPVTGKGLAMRPKSASRTALYSESEAGWSNSIPIGLGDSIISDVPTGVRKSSSTPSLYNQDTNNSSSVWPTSRWSLKPDLQVLSSAAMNIPMFDGLPKPISGRRSKAALD